MRTEELVAKLEFARPEFRLAGYEEVGLPLYRIRFRAYTLEHKAIPPIEEFVMKAIGVGMTSVETVAGILGLDERVCRGALSNLIRSENVRIGGTEVDRLHRLQITRKGREVMDDAELITAEQGTFEIDFDGILRRVVTTGDQVVFTGRELRETGLLEIPAYPVRPPEIKDLDFQQVARQLRSGGASRRELLSIIAIEKRHRFFVRGIALVYCSKEDEHTEVGFVVNNRMSTEHEIAFARSEGPKRVGMDRVSGPVDWKRLGLDLSAIPAPKESEELRRRAATSREAVDGAREELNKAGTAVEVARARDALGAAEKEREASEEALRARSFRHLMVQDHPPLLDEALTKARSRVLIVSPWIAACVVDGEFLRKIAVLCRSGVRVYVGYGIGKEEGRRRRKGDADAEAELVRLGQAIDALTVKRFGNTHAKLLGYDREWFVVSSFNWLSFKGARDRGYRDEQGMLIRDSAAVEERFVAELGRFEGGGGGVGGEGGT